MPGPEFLRHRTSVVNVGPFSNALRKQSVPDDASIRGAPFKNSPVASAVAIPEERPVASGNGVSISINLTEPTLFLQGCDSHNGSSSPSTVMLRGSMHLKVTKTAKIKAVTLKFNGTATTRWPEGIPPKRVDFEEVDQFHNHTWTFFNAAFPNAEHSTGADHVHIAEPSTKLRADSPYSGSPAPSSVNLAAPRSGLHDKRLSLQHTPSASFEKGDKSGSSVNQKGYKTFYPGDYIYNFEHAIDSRLPETINVELGSVKYQFEATVERSGAFRANLIGHKEVEMIRAPAEGSLEQVEPIAISRNWEDQLHYDIVISGKSFPLGAKVPIAFKLTPLAKVQCHRIKVFVTENTEYFCSQKRVHRMEPTRKVLLFEKRADSPPNSTFPGSTMRITAGGGVPYDQREAAARGERVETSDTGNLLGCLTDDTQAIGPTEMEFNVQLPGCSESVDKEKNNRLHFDTTYHNIQVHHWIKIVMRLSKPDKDDPTKRRHFEISIDSPFTILSCRATTANTSLPSYTSPQRPLSNAEVPTCSCSGAPKRRISPSHLPTLSNITPPREPENVSSLDLSRPEAAHVHNSQPVLQRPMHMLRAPSFNPPAFEDEQPPPPLVTPPPQYNDIASPSSGLADYFSRLAEEYDSDEDRGSARVNVPLTPGSRINRSMELQRTWAPLAH